MFLPLQRSYTWAIRLRGWPLDFTKISLIFGLLGLTYGITK
jgi:hypothetical protein